MKLLQEESTSPSLQTCATAVLDTVPLVMRTIRAEMRSHRTPDLSVPQFRAIVYVNRNANASVSDVAEHLGLSLPTVSKLVDKLVVRGLLSRQDSPIDRRYKVLMLTPEGKTTLDAAVHGTQQHLADLLSVLPPDDLATVSEAMDVLYRVMVPDPAPDSSER